MASTSAITRDIASVSSALQRVVSESGPLAKASAALEQMKRDSTDKDECKEFWKVMDPYVNLGQKTVDVAVELQGALSRLQKASEASIKIQDTEMLKLFVDSSMGFTKHASLGDKLVQNAASPGPMLLDYKKAATDQIEGKLSGRRDAGKAAQAAGGLGALGTLAIAGAVLADVAMCGLGGGLITTATVGAVCGAGAGVGVASAAALHGGRTMQESASKRVAERAAAVQGLIDLASIFLPRLGEAAISLQDAVLQLGRVLQAWKAVEDAAIMLHEAKYVAVQAKLPASVETQLKILRSQMRA